LLLAVVHWHIFIGFKKVDQLLIDKKG